MIITFMLFTKSNFIYSIIVFSVIMPNIAFHFNTVNIETIII